jgi:hypothetical protein
MSIHFPSTFSTPFEYSIPFTHLKANHFNLPTSPVVYPISKLDLIAAGHVLSSLNNGFLFRGR